VVAIAPALAAPAPPPSPTTGHVDVIEVSGLIDPINEDFVIHALNGAQHDGALALVMRINSTGSTISTNRVDALVFRLAHSPVPVAAWVGPTGAKAERAGYALLAAAGVQGAAPGTHLGLAPAPLFGNSPASPLAGRVVSGDQAVKDGVVQLGSSTIGDFILGLDGRTFGQGVLHIPSHVVPAAAGGTPHRAPDIQARFGRLSLTATLLHTVASRSVTYLLLLIGLLMAVLEFFTAGIGIGAAVAAGCLVLAGYGIGVLPVRPGGIALLCLAVFGYAIDLQAGTPRTWTVIGTISLVVGSLILYPGTRPASLALLVGLVGPPLFMVAGMPALVRSRFSTPTIGRESMIGEMGTALAEVSPEGTVEVRGAPWRARTNRATPIAAGDHVRVIGIDGLLLEVEPEVGGARDARH
jgi:membrane-bound serine protease (ClpP class)